mgnify:CR=1 FL=1
MTLFEYTARDTSGKTRNGIVDSNSEAAAITLLRSQGFFIISLSEKKNSIAENLFSFIGVPFSEIVVFTRQLSTMITAGLPIARALEVLSTQTTNKNMKKVIVDVLRSVEGGANLSNAFSRFPKVFSPTYQALVSAGEASGKLDVILQRLADVMEGERDLNSKFISAMIYPAIIFIAMIVVFIIMMLFVVPKLADMYESMNVDLPFVTQVMINFSSFMVTRWYFALLLVFAIAIVIRVFSQSEQGKEIISAVWFKLPVLGKINRTKELTDYTRTLSLLISSGIPIVDSLRIVEKVVGSPQMRKAAAESAKYVERGNALSEFLKSQKVYPPMLYQMAAVGEETGQLDSVLEKVSTFYAAETEHMVKGLSSALEPLILIFLGGMVGLLIVSIITPIYQITNSIA